MSITFRKIVLNMKAPRRLALILFSTLFFHCMNYEAVDRAPLNWVEYCQVKRHAMYVENIVKMYRIQMKIPILFWDGRDDLYYARNNWSGHWCMDASLFVQLSSTKVHLDRVLVWHFISRRSGSLVWRI